MNILVYITGHGLGHASREAEILNEIAKRIPHINLIIRTSAPEWFFSRSLNKSSKYSYSEAKIDIGVLQRDALHLDRKNTMKLFQKFWQNRYQFIENEVYLFRNQNIKHIIADIPPIAFEVAEKLGVKSTAITNFSWDWIYGNYTKLYKEYDYLIDEIRKSYAKASVLLRLPFYGKLDAFKKIIDVPLVARHSSYTPDEIRRKLGLFTGIPLVLMSFGGVGIDFSCIKKKRYREYQFVTAFPSKGNIPGAIHIDERALIISGLSFPDIVNASSVVIGKPGYGLVSECITGRIPLIYTSRGDFAEYDVFVREMKKYISAVYMPKKDLYGGNWSHYLEMAINAKFPESLIETNGAQKCAEYIIKNL